MTDRTELAEAARLFRGVLTGPRQDPQVIAQHATKALQRNGIVVLSDLGSGSYGLIFKASTAAGAKVAVKVARCSATWRDYGFLEPCALRMCNHPNIVRVHAVMDDICSFTMELCEGALLDLIKASTEWIAPDRLRSWYEQCIGAVAYLHAKGIIHGDLKAENILHLNGGATLKICDLGMLRFEGCQQEVDAVCTYIQTPPEAILGVGCHTKAMDVWALGLVCLHMLELGRSIAPLCNNNHYELLIVQFRRFGTPTPETWPGLQSLPHWKDSFPKFKAPPPGGVTISYRARIAPEPPTPDQRIIGVLVGALVMCPERRATAAALLQTIRKAPAGVKRSRAQMEHA